MKFYYPLKPQRISLDSDLFKRLESDANFICQVKKNGWRIQIHKHDEDVTIFTRHRNPLRDVALDIDWSLIQKTILDSVKCSSAIIDGEFLHRRGTRKNSFYVWDIFEQDGRVLTTPYGERKRALKDIVIQGPLFELATDVGDNFTKVWESLDSLEDEGLVIKDIQELLYISHTKTINSPRQFKILKY